MAKTSAGWTLLAHGQIERLSENLWRVEGALPRTQWPNEGYARVANSPGPIDAKMRQR